MTHDQILQSVAEKHGYTVSQLVGKRRKTAIVAARKEAAQRLRDIGLSYPEIGQLLGRHHTTIMSLLNKIKERRGNTEVSKGNAGGNATPPAVALTKVATAAPSLFNGFFRAKYRGEWLPVTFEMWQGVVEDWGFTDGIKREVTEPEDLDIRRQIEERNWDGD